MEIELNPKYQLSQTLFKHSGAARCLAVYKNKLITGGIDKKVNVYERAGEKNLFDGDKVVQFKFFKDYIYSVVPLNDDQFIVGCKDGNIYICSYEDTENPLVVLEGVFLFPNFQNFSGCFTFEFEKSEEIFKFLPPFRLFYAYEFTTFYISPKFCPTFRKTNSSNQATKEQSTAFM